MKRGTPSLAPPLSNQIQEGSGQHHLQIHLWIHICLLTFEGPLHLQFQSHTYHTLHEEGPLHLWLQSHICLTLDDGKSTTSLDPSPGLFISMSFALHLHKPYFFYFSSAILIALNDNLELTVLCRLRDFFKDEIDMCSNSLLFVNSIFCCELHFFKTFSHVCQIYVAEVLIIHFAGTAI